MTARLFAQTFTILTLTAGSLAFAQTPKPDDCVYQGQDQLQCDGNIIVPAGTAIKDQTVILMTPKDVFFGSPEEGMTITCSDAAPVDPSDLNASPALCGRVMIFANTLHGALSAQARAAGRAPAPIELHVGFYAKRFRMNLDTEDGLLFVERSGKEHAEDKNLRWASR